MQGTDDMAYNPDFNATARSTAAGLEAWMNGATTEAAGDTAPQPDSDALAAIAEVGPVNAAEALVLDAFSGAHKLVGTDGAELVVDPENHAYHFESTSLKPLAALLLQPAAAWTPVYTTSLQSSRSADPAQPLERLRWYAGLVATPGILSRRLHRGDLYKLAHWPETEREFPRHFRIARAMLKEPAAVAAIAAASATTPEEVIDYINASHAAGRLESLHGGAAPAKGASRAGRLMAALNKPLFAH